VIAAALDEQDDAQYGAVCVSESTGVRLDDDACGDWDDEGQGSVSGTYFMWFPTGGPGYIPPVGQPLPPNAPGVRKVPSGAPIAKGIPKTGGQMSAIQRGGFGVKSGTSGGTGAKAGAAAGKSGGS
jgi:hypothetical protein